MATTSILQTISTDGDLIGATPREPAPSQISQADAVFLLDDPTRTTVTVTQAAAILGVSPATAHHANRRTGYLIDGVPVLRCGRRCVVSTAHLRIALGRPALI